jgi:hypothetical protein
MNADKLEITIDKVEIAKKNLRTWQYTALERAKKGGRHAHL